MLNSFRNLKISKKNNFITKFRAIAITSLILTMTSTSGFAKNVHGLTSSQLQQLKLLSLPVIVPTYIPTGFKIKSVDVKNVGTSKIGNKYKITYTKLLKDAKSNEFYIETTNEGIGEMYLSNPIAVKSRFGDTQIYVDSMTENDTNIKLNNCIYMEWICYKGNCFRIVSGGGCNTEENGHEYHLRISKEEVIKVINSIQEIK